MNRDVAQTISRFLTAVRNDPEALLELRQLVLAIFIAAGVVYGLYIFQVEAQEKAKVKNLSYKNELATSLGGKLGDPLASGRMQKLMVTKQELTDKLALLRFQEQILREQHTAESSGESFAKVIFTLLPLSPVDIENGFVRMNVLDTRAYDYFDVNPINLQGDMAYSEFLYYLQYLEGRPEVGMIGKLALEIVPSKPFAEKVKVHFDVVLGRIQLRAAP